MLPSLKLALMLSCNRFNESALFVQVLNGLWSFTLLNSLTTMHLVSATVSITIRPDGLMTFMEMWRCCCVCNKRQSSAQHMVRLTAIICPKLFMLSTLLKTKKSKTVLDAVYPTAASPVDVAVGTVSVAVSTSASAAVTEVISADDGHTAAAAGDASTWQ